MQLRDDLSTVSRAAAVTIPEDAGKGDWANTRCKLQQSACQSLSNQLQAKCSTPHVDILSYSVTGRGCVLAQPVSPQKVVRKEGP